MNMSKIAGYATALVLALIVDLSAARAQNTGDLDWRMRGFYAVAGLRPGDTLNVRERSTARSPVVGELDRGTVVFATGRSHRRNGQPWLQINHQEGLAWVNGAYLVRRQVMTIANSRAPVAGSCGGFEPGWDASWNQSGLRANSMSGPIGSARFKRVITPQGAPTPSVIEFTDPGAPLRMTLVLQDQQCELLPVDRDSYQTGLLLVEKDGALTAFSGCCDPAQSAFAPAN